MSIRPYVGLANPAKARFSATSSDGGATFGAVKAEPQLVDAGGVCGSVVSDPSGQRAPKGTVYYSHPDAGGRTNMTLYVSQDDAKTWEVVIDVYAGGSAYSSMALTGSGQVGLLFEKDDYASLAFASLTP
jgi:sialidase-1